MLTMSGCTDFLLFPCLFLSLFYKSLYKMTPYSKSYEYIGLNQNCFNLTRNHIEASEIRSETTTYTHYVYTNF